MELGYRQWGLAMQDDITDATHWAIAQGVADPKRICIYGASYGGYAALMGAAREPDLYRCAIGLSGPYDLSKLYRWGDIHRSDYGMHYLNVVLGTDKQALVANSPISRAASIHIPVLLAHGEQDARVPIEYANAMRSALKKAGRPPEFVSYTWEGHGLADPANAKDFYSRMLAFLASNLGSASQSEGGEQANVGAAKTSAGN
jgi:dipeptidyl aminopeptidase/acylaminoacyl peptidase